MLINSFGRKESAQCEVIERRQAQLLEWPQRGAGEPSYSYADIEKELR